MDRGPVLERKHFVNRAVERIYLPMCSINLDEIGALLGGAIANELQLIAGRGAVARKVADNVAIRLVSGKDECVVAAAAP